MLHSRCSELGSPGVDGQLLKTPVSREGYGHRFPGAAESGLTAQASLRPWVSTGWWRGFGELRNLPELVSSSDLDRRPQAV